MKIGNQSLKRAVFLAFILLFVCVSDAAGADIRINGNKMTVHAEESPLREILQLLAGRGVRVYMDPELDPKISASFKNRDMQDALGSILKPFNHVLVWKTVHFEPGKSISALSEIRIFNPGRKDRAKPLGDTTFSIAGDKDGLYVKDEILVRPKPGMSRSEFDEFLVLLEAIGGTVVEGNERLGIYRVILPENTDVRDLARRLGNHPGISGVEPNHAYPIFTPYRRSVNGSQTGNNVSVPAAGTDTAPVAILDTGLARDSGLNDLVLASLDAVNPDRPISDTRGHGTQMALIASGTVKPSGLESDKTSACPIIPIRAFDDNGYTSNFTIMRAVEFALDKGARVMSLSWGAETDSAFLKDAMDFADANGMITVAAAGNEPTGNPVFPAAYPSVTGVGALAPNGMSWEKSNYGNFVSIYAPGFANLPVGHEGEPGPYAGTSISTAYTANRISRYLSENPAATTQDVFDALKGNLGQTTP